jgi:hypothetical protein
MRTKNKIGKGDFQTEFTETVKLRGMFRIHIVDKKTRKIVGDSGLIKNQITNYGLNSCLAAAPIGAASVQAAGFIIGSGTVPASDATALDGSNTDQYSAFAQSAVQASTAARMTQSFDGNASSMATLANIGVLAASTGSLIAGATFASSSLGTDQDVNATYEFQYSTS